MNEVLCGKSVVIFEDEFLSVLTLSDMVSDLGCEVVGHATSLHASLDLAGRAVFDIALLDINLQGEASYAVAQELASREVAFLFTTGTTDLGPMWCRDRPRLLKPFSTTSLERMMMASLSASQAEIRV